MRCNFLKLGLTSYGLELADDLIAVNRFIFDLPVDHLFLKLRRANRSSLSLVPSSIDNSRSIRLIAFGGK